MTIGGAVTGPWEVGCRQITPQEFGLLRDLIYREAGICLSEAKRALLMGRLNRRLRELGIGSFTAYYHRVKTDELERIQMLDAISTNETHFFREPQHFEFLEREVYPRWTAEEAAGARPRRLRVWSAACSTGEEPYSVAMSLMAAFPGWQLEVLATDLSTRVLAQAREATWPLEASHKIPPAHLRAFMLKGTGSQAGRMKAAPELRAVVRFERLNLHDHVYDVAGPYDLILCRNALIYFDAQSKSRVVSRLLDQLAPEGYFFLGHAESLNGITDRVRWAGPTVYSLATAAPHHSRRAFARPPTRLA